LKEIEPVIWRQFFVPGSIYLHKLHDVIQIIMGWLDYHLYEFKIGGQKYAEDHEPDFRFLHAEKCSLADVIKAKTELSNIGAILATIYAA
jgi:hypothetical protein